MKNAGRKLVALFALAAIACLSALYQLETGKKAVTASTSVDGREIPVLRVQRAKAVALTFEAAGKTQDAETVLDILKEKEVQATFFVTGTWVDAQKESVSRILDEGHDLGNMTMDGESLADLSGGECRRQIMALHRKIAKTWAYQMTLFRMPRGEYTDAGLRTVYACGYLPVGWSVGTDDWKSYGADEVLKKLSDLKNSTGGEIVRMTLGSADCEAALPDAIDFLREMGLEILPVSRLAVTDNYRMEADGTQVPEGADP